MRPGSVVRILLLVIGAALVAYGVSDHPFYGGPPGIGLLQKLIIALGAGLVLGALLPKLYAERLLLLAVSGLLMLLVAEVAGNQILGPVFRPIYQEDSRLIFRFIEGRRSAITLPAVNGGGTITHRINSAGFRGEELMPRVPERKRVVVYGDSFIHAYYAADEDTFPVQLGKQLNGRAGADVEVINAGVSSYGPDQMLLKIEAELPKLDPDLLVISIYAGNDYGDLLRNKLFQLDGAGVLEPNAWRLDPQVASSFWLSQRESILVRALRSTYASLTAAPVQPSEVGRPDTQFLLDEAAREYRSFISGDPLVTNTHVDYYSADVSLVPASESARYKIRMMRAVLERIRAIGDAAGVPVLFLFIPHPADLTDQYDWGAVDKDRYPEYEGRNQTAPLERFAAETASRSVSLFDAFAAGDPNALYFHGGDDHWSPAGQALAARLVADYILKEGLIAAP